MQAGAAACRNFAIGRLRRARLDDLDRRVARLDEADAMLPDVLRLAGPKSEEPLEEVDDPAASCVATPR